jgi:uncharacterized membrane protein YphA (DoxX/SURF4 family)
MKHTWTWLAQIVAALIIGGAGVLKFAHNPSDIYVFQTLGMEPFGRFIIGALELSAALMLMSRAFAAVGSLLALGTMMGAAIAHATVLGLHVQGDGGLHVLLLALVVSSSVPVLLLKRRELPLVGRTL